MKIDCANNLGRVLKTFLWNTIIAICALISAEKLDYILRGGFNLNPISKHLDYNSGEKRQDFWANLQSHSRLGEWTVYTQSPSLQFNGTEEYSSFECESVIE